MINKSLREIRFFSMLYVFTFFGFRFLTQITQHPAAVADPGDIGRKDLLVARYKLLVVAAVHQLDSGLSAIGQGCWDLVSA